LEEVNDLDKAVIGTLQILSHPGKVLFDTGATTSFILQEFVDLYGITCNKLEYPITILSAGGTKRRPSRPTVTDEVHPALRPPRPYKAQHSL
jgi:hypothetical protein